MKSKTAQHLQAAAIAVLILAHYPLGISAGESTEAWRISILGGGIHFEGDEPVTDAALGAIGIGYDVSPRWTLEGLLSYAPEVKSSYRSDWATGERISRLSERAGRDLEKTSALHLSIDGLMHLAPARRLNPYLAIGAGFVSYEHTFDRSYEPMFRIGGGLFFHLSERWALRLDSRVLMAGTDSEFNTVTTAGLTFRSQPYPQYAASYAAEPVTIRTFELYLNFDPGQSVIKPEYRSELDVIGRLLEQQSKATALIEGHEQAGENDEQQALELTTRRAEAVQDYLQYSWKIRRKRLNAIGIGTARPNPAPERSSERITVTVSLP